MGGGKDTTGRRNSWCAGRDTRKGMVNSEQETESFLGGAPTHPVGGGPGWESGRAVGGAARAVEREPGQRRAEEIGRAHV